MLFQVIQQMVNCIKFTKRKDIGLRLKLLGQKLWISTGLYCAFKLIGKKFELRGPRPLVVINNINVNYCYCCTRKCWKKLKKQEAYVVIILVIDGRFQLLGLGPLPPWLRQCPGNKVSLEVRAIGNTASDLTDPSFEPQTSHSKDESVADLIQ